MPFVKDRPPIVKPSITFTPHDPFSLPEIKEAVRAAFPRIGHMDVRKLYVHKDVARVRANWYDEDDKGVFISRSLFVFVTSVDGKLVVEDKTTSGKAERNDLYDT